MKIYRSKQGSFTERPHYGLEEIEKICLEELQAVQLYPSHPGPIRIERFVEKRFNVSPSYEDLDAGVLGFTQFGPKGVEAIVISRSLSEEGTEVAERRIKTTLAHESGHGLLQAHLFVLGAEPMALFGSEMTEGVPRILCRTENSVETESSKPAGYDGRWWEFQANRAIGALLLPRPLVLKCLEPLMASGGLLGLPMLPTTKRAEANRRMVDVFEVNPIVARLRLDEMFPATNEAQLTL